MILFLLINTEKILSLVEGLETHPVGMKRQDDFRFPDDFSRGLQSIENGPVGHVAFARSGQATIKCHLERGSMRIAIVEDGGGFLRTHGVAT